MGRAWALLLAGLAATMAVADARAQQPVTQSPVTQQPVTFQPAGCDFRAVFASAPKQQEVLAPLADGTRVKIVTASLQGPLDGQQNFFRAECTLMKIPPDTADAVLIEDLREVGIANKLESIQAWLVRDGRGGTIGRLRGELTSAGVLFILDMHRYVTASNRFDVWIGSAKDAFPTQGNVVFLKGVRLRGFPVE